MGRNPGYPYDPAQIVNLKISTYVQNSSGDNDTAFSKLKIWSYFFLWIQTIIFLSKRKYWLESIKCYFSSKETINLYSVRKNEMGFLFLGKDEALAFKAFDELINWRGGGIIDEDIDVSNISYKLLAGRYVVALSSENCIRKCNRVSL